MHGLQVLHEDNHLIAVNKPAGLLVHGDETGDETLADLVKDYIKVRYKKPGDVFLGVIHRLDRPVSGVVIFARTSKALTRMNKLLQEKMIKKTYLAITKERPEPLQGNLVHYILKDRDRNVAKAYDSVGRRTKAAKRSELNYELVAEVGANHLIKVNPLTGRPHQIRVQLSKMGWPIRGDKKYGFRQRRTDGTIYLHCLEMAFEHPVKKEPVSIQAETPVDQIWALFEGVEI